MDKCKIDNVKLKIIEPIFKKDSIPVVFATDDNFIPYLYVAIQSLVDNSSKENSYDVVILYENVSEYKQRQFKALEAENISIRFYDMSQLMNQYKDTWYVHWNWSNAVYYRFFITKILKGYDKVLYLDGDIIIKCDVAELYNIDLENNWIGAIVDISQQMKGYSGEKYRETILKIRREEYFNAGVISFNLKKLREFDFTKKCIETLERLGKPVFQDQDVLNLICNGNVKYIDFSYNLLWNCIHYFKDAGERMERGIYSRYIKAWETFKLIHYAGVCKPWKQPWLQYSEFFWQYARKTPFYEELLFANIISSPIYRQTIKNAINGKKYYGQYLKCKILKLLTFGRAKQHYTEKAKRLKMVVDDYRKTLKA